MDKNEKLKLGDIYFAPKEFFLNNSVGKLKQQIESYADVRENGMVMCAVIEDMNSVFKSFLDYIIKVINGETYAKNEINGFNEISIFKDGVTL